MTSGCKRLGLVLLPWILATPVARAADEEAIRVAIRHGVDYLKRLQQPDGSWSHSYQGLTALAALTLMECGVSIDDPTVQRAATVLREASINMKHNYSISLSIMFFDRLGDPEDVPLIEALTARLLAGQNNMGGWSYHCPSIADTEVRRLTTLLRERDRGRRESRLPLKFEAAPLPPRSATGQLQGSGMSGGDNSNTQFATLALWVARRHRLPVDAALARIEERYRRSQNPDGGWGYMISPATRMSHNSTPSMTCAGVLGLAVAHGAASDPAVGARAKTQARPRAGGKTESKGPDAIRDPAIYHALKMVGAWIDSPTGAKGLRFPGPSGPRAAPGVGGAVGGNRLDYYFLWSLERVAMALSRKVIGHREWFPWGADLILAAQQPDGSWSSNYSGGPDTCFALLFLARSNLTRDLSAALRGRIRDGEVKLRATARAEPSDASTPTFDEEANQLSNQLVESPAERQTALIQELRDRKGVVNTEALARAIPQLADEVKQRAREALAERLARMTEKTLREKLGEDDLEVRRAAALACAVKEDRAFVPDLIRLLEDRETSVARAALAALKALTGEDFGPAPSATMEQRSLAILRWKTYWDKERAAKRP